MMIRRLFLWIIGNTVCCTHGHDPVKEVREDEHFIHFYKCNRCDCTLGMPNWKTPPPPPHSTPEMLVHWNNYMQEQIEKWRQGIVD